MQACCHLTYEKYLNPDGTLDRDALAAVHKKDADRRACRSPSTHPDYLHPPGDTCYCACHIKGGAILH